MFRKESTSENAHRPHMHFLIVALSTTIAYVIFLTIGFGPIGRDTIFLSLGTGALVGSIGRPRHHTFEIARDWFPLAVAMLAYDFARTFADNSGNAVAVASIIKLERIVGFGTLPAVNLYNAVGGFHRPIWLAMFTDFVWLSHFFVPLLFACYLWIRRRDEYAMYATTMCLLFVLAVVVYWIQPSAPPWFAASAEGLHGNELGHLMRSTGQGLEFLGIDFAKGIVEKGASASNPFAAFPSLHGGISILVAYFAFVRLPRCRWSFLVWLYPLAMTFAIVSTGEHYLVDVVAAIPFVGLAWLIAERISPLFFRLGERFISSGATQSVDVPQR